MNQVKQIILSKKDALASAISEPLSQLAARCVAIWHDPDALDAILLKHIPEIANCESLYAWNLEGQEISSLVKSHGFDTSWRGKDLSSRPYLKNNLPFKGIMLSSVYHCQWSRQECVTALQAVRHDEVLLGFIAADFSLEKLARETESLEQQPIWQQFKGDPAVRGQLFMQHRIQSLLDEHIDSVNETIYDLITQHGIFHCKIHYSSGRCSFWQIEDPYTYQIHGVEEIIDPDIVLAYPLYPYPTDTKISKSQLKAILGQFKALRFADETIYLRSASINVKNGMLGLTFSCDGSHYMPVVEFLEKNLDFWFG
jgi:hypothetical protein